MTKTTTQPITQASLFSGIGGAELAAEWMGWKNIFHCDINPFSRHVLDYYWPNSISYDDIKQTDFTIHRGNVTVLTGGFPCQPYSVAGSQKGTDDDRHLWSEMLRAIKQIQPHYIVGENVRGLVSWNKGLVFDQVQTDLENEGYEVWPFLLPAAAVNAPHRRDRIFFVAYNATYASNQRCNYRSNNRKERPVLHDKDRLTTQSKPARYKRQFRFSKVSDNRISYHAQNKRFRGLQDTSRATRSQQSHDTPRGKHRIPVSTRFVAYSYRKRYEKRNTATVTGAQARQRSEKNFTDKSQNWKNFPTQSPVCDGNDGLSGRLDPATILKTVGRKVNKKFVPYNYWRNESIKAGGNAIVPQVMHMIFKAIQEHINLTK